jgi:type II secretory pathway pseudopilin PulG
MLFQELQNKKNFSLGFSLTEVVIIIAIVSVLAGLAVPGIMTAANNSRRVSITKQTMSMIGDAFNDKLEANAIDLTQGFQQFVNVTGGAGLKYNRYITSGAAITVDPSPNPVVWTNVTFTPGGTENEAVIYLKNGGVLVIDTDLTFGTGADGAIPVLFDPDGVARGDTNSVEFWLYSDGRIRTAKTILATTTTDDASTPFTSTPSAIADPAWLVL